MKKTATFILLFLVLQLSAQQWHELGPCGGDTYGNHVAAQSGTGQIHSITFDPDNPHIIYAGSPFGGLWKSTDNGNHWSRKGIDTTYALELASVCDAAFARKNGVKTLWVVTGHPGARGAYSGGAEPYTSGIYYSNDEGATFTPLKAFNKKYHFELKDKKHISRIVINPQNPDNIFVATSDGLYRTLKSGKSWQLVLTEDELPGSYTYTQGIANVEFSTVNANKIVYAGGTDIYRSTKGGKKGSFKSMTHEGTDLFDDADCFKNLNFALDVNSYNGKDDVLYAMCYFVGDTCGAYRGRQGMTLFRYNGRVWSRTGLTEYGLADAIRIKVASVPGNPAIVYAGAVTTSLSSDTGKTWKTCTQYNQPGHADIHAIEVMPGTRDMITGTDGGIFVYNYEAKQVEERNDGLCLAQITDMSTSATNPGKILVGMQDVGSAMLNKGSWTKLPFGGDGYPGQYIDQTDEWNIYTCNNEAYSNTHSGEKVSWKPYYLCSSRLGDFPNNLTQQPGEPSVIYYTGKDVYRSTNYGMDHSWCRISDFASMPDVYINPAGQIISDLQIWDSLPAIMYVAFNAYENCCNSYLFRTVTGGIKCDSVSCATPKNDGSWQRIKIPEIKMDDGQAQFLANGKHSISSIALNNEKIDELWIAYDFSDLNSADFKVFHSTDGGNSWMRDDKGLPDYPCTNLQYIKGEGGLLVSALNGVYYKAPGKDWVRYGEGLPRVGISDMEINYKARLLRVATFGAGVWEIKLP